MLSKYKLCPCSTSLLLASNNICFQKSGDMLNKNTLGVKKVRGQSEAALQIGMCDHKGGQVTKPIIVVKICYKLLYIIQVVKKIFDK